MASVTNSVRGGCSDGSSEIRRMAVGGQAKQQAGDVSGTPACRCCRGWLPEYNNF